ncbi:succinate dehydrogenase cytochrome B subunit [Paracoccidioides lutzii Pb01]|uniref:Succinate dehydrogenase cytochrome B subunit n=1 Tax=Paracoccidioides lutzii (strain ATCC MYA-826 / Pb01) TaxID=502779 RepID=C1H0D8_PARBA|nr:succinate dehydrogenase cytochrome B subunit [Paracoccidioides lutzii Pb01]EEH33179.1 succinate dehydrogenase cytochrome B subunit [Paracoccidioides lutzii Pb01]
MFPQRVAQQSLRRLAAHNPSQLRIAVSRIAAPVAIATGNHIQTRSTTSSTSEDPSQILPRQRLNRPVSPHLSIYQPQVTWVLSSLNRITGLALAGSLYIFSSFYLVSPLLGWHLESPVIAAAFGALPLAAKVGLKFTAALPFMFHALNGCRHLIWDLGKQFSNKQVIATGWMVVGLTFSSALALACFV